MANADRGAPEHPSAALGVVNPEEASFLPPEPATRTWHGAAPAGWGRRVGATLLDSLLIGLPLTVLAISLGVADSADALLRGAGWVAGVVYAALLLAYHRGQTLGKQAAGVRVLTEGGPRWGWHARRAAKCSRRSSA
jgi:uncharacterized RDD family membrane protein YckC